MIHISIKNIVLCFVVMIGLYSAHYVYAQVMSGATYRIQSDSVNFGGNYSTSTTYLIQDTAGEIATGDSASTNFKMRAGYQNMQENIISLSAITGVTLSPALGGVTGGVANGSTTFTVITDDPAGYMVTIRASSSPALQSGASSIPDYATTTASTPDFNFASSSTASVFGFSVEGTDIDQKFKDNGSNCNVGAGDTADKCWVGLTTSNQTIVNRSSSNQPSGTITTLKFRAQVGSAHIQTQGIYVSTTTITAISI